MRTVESVGLGPEDARMGQTLNLSATVVIAPDHLVARLGEESVVLGLGKAMYYGLDDVAARAWDLMQSPVAVSTVRDTILQEYEVDAETCETDLIAFLASLEAEGMIEVTSGQAG